MNKTKLIFGVFLSIFYITTNAQNIKTGRTTTSVNVKVNTDKKLVVRNTLSGINTQKINTDKGSFIRLDVDGYTPSEQIGEPLLPVSRNLIEVPLKATYKIKVKSYKVQIYNLNDLGYNGKLIPTQPPVSKSDQTKKPLIINSKSYAKKGYLSHPIVTIDDIGIMRGVRMARLNISPVQYNPSTNTIKVYSDIETEIVFENADITATNAEKEKYYSPIFNTFQSKLLNNKTPLQTRSAEMRYPVKYVIVSAPMFKQTLKPFVQWQTKRGFKVVEAYTDNAAVGTTTTNIKSYLQSLYLGATENDPAPSYILFVGDIAQVPSFAGTTGSHPTDLYYAEYTGDFLPEVFYGRFSASTTTDLASQIEKTLQYERCEMPDKSFLNETVLIAGSDPNYGPLNGNGQINYMASTYYNTTSGFVPHIYLYPTNSSASSQIIQNVSTGVGFANYTAHGSSSGWADPSFQISDVASLQNLNKYPLMIGNCCLTNKFDDPVCFGEALLRAYHKGAIGYIGGSNSTYWDEDYYWACGVKAVSANPVYNAVNLGAIDRIMHTHNEAFSQWYVTQGQMVQAGNLAVTIGSPNSFHYYWEIYHLMGDPSLMPYFKIPLALTASYSPLLPLGSTLFNVTTEPYAYVGISRDSTLYGAALADSSGNAIINLAPIVNPGYVSVVVTKQNRQTKIDSVLVASPQGPYIILNNSQLTDQNGNHNGVADFGELIKLNVNLKNVGNSGDTAIYAVLTSFDPYVIITDSIKTWGIISSQNTKTVDSAFAFTVKSFVPDQHIANFNLAIHDQAGNIWNYNLNILLNAPLLQISYVSLNDNASGNHNGRLDPGETVNVTFKVSNVGHSNAANTNTVLTSTTGFINILNPNSNLNTINQGASANVTYTISATNVANIGDSYNLTLNANSNSYLSQLTINNGVGLIMEDFETHNFTKFSWDTTDIHPWIIATDTVVAPGLYSSKSGVITDNQTSSLKITLDVLTNDSISFYRKVSCEHDPSGSVDYDNLQFLIDGTIVDKWDGETNWSKVTYPITSGTHIISWVYNKDVNTSSGSDCAWLDNITFPAVQSLVNVPNFNNLEKGTDFTIYPNPAKDNFNLMYRISKEASTSFKIFNTTGQCVFNYDKEHQLAGIYSKEINVSGLDKGVYYCTMLLNDKIITRKFVITK